MTRLKFIQLFLFSSYCSFAQNIPTKLWQSNEFIETINVNLGVIKLDKEENPTIITTQVDESPFLGFTIVRYDSLGQEIYHVKNPDLYLELYGDMVMDSIGNVFTCVRYSPWSQLDTEGFIYKYSPTGNLQFKVYYSESTVGHCFIQYLGLDKFGRLIILGINQKSEMAPTDSEWLFIACLNPDDGSTVWEKKYIDRFFGYNLKIMDDRIEALVAHSLPNSKSEFQIIQFDFDGNELQKSSGPVKIAMDFNTITESGDVLIGYRYGYSATRMNAQGDTLWHRKRAQESFNCCDGIYSLKEDEFQNTYITGIWSDSTDRQFAVLDKYSITGELVWEIRYIDSIMAPIAPSSSGFFVAVDDKYAYMTGPSGIDIPKAAVAKILLFNRETGELIYELTLSDQVFCAGEQIIPTSDGFYFFGWSSKNDGMGNSYEVITARYRLPQISTTTEPKKESDFLYGPNPCSQEITIDQIDRAAFNAMELSSSSGEVLLRQSIYDERAVLNLMNLPDGAYFLTLFGNKTRLTKKIVLARD